MWDALSPLDGRYQQETAEARAYFSEGALFRYRLRVIVEYFIALSDTLAGSSIRPASFALSEELQSRLRHLSQEFGPSDVARIKAIEAEIKHDVKAVEYYLRERLPAELAPHQELLYLGLTSEDVNNLAYALSLKEFLHRVYFPAARLLLGELLDMALRYKSIPMLGRTHGQPASPTTMGKELAVFAARLQAQWRTLKTQPITAKLNGAVGNYSAHCAAFPTIDWIAFSRQFIETLGLTPVLVTTQIEPRDHLAAIATRSPASTPSCST